MVGHESQKLAESIGSGLWHKKSVSSRLLGGGGRRAGGEIKRKEAYTLLRMVAKQISVNVKDLCTFVTYLIH